MSMVARTPFRIAHVFDIKVDIKEWVDDDDDDHVRARDIDNIDSNRFSKSVWRT